jgi:hypothetical protein
MKSLKHHIYISIHVYEEFEDTKEVTKIHKLKKDNRRNKKDKTTNKDLKNTTQKCKDRPKQTPLITGFELRVLRVSRSCSTNNIHPE